MKDYDVSQIITGDALKVLSRIADNIVDCCITSPPYFGLRESSIHRDGKEKTGENI